MMPLSGDRYFRFADPWWLLLAGVWLAGLLLTWVRHRRAARAAIVYSATDLLADLPKTLLQQLRPVLNAMAHAGVLLLIGALARPQFGSEPLRNTTQGIAVMMCLDKSGSMKAVDFMLDGHRVDRLEAVKEVFRQFVTGQGTASASQLAGRPNDLIGIVAFGGYPECLCPLTLDHHLLVDVLERIEITRQVTDRFGNPRGDPVLRQEMATAIGDGLALSCERLRQSKAKSKVVILLSDGENNAGVIVPDKAIAAARELGIRIHSIGVGSRTGRVDMPKEDQFGRIRYESIVVPMDEKLLRKAAAETGGKFFMADSTEMLGSVYAEIDRLEKTEVQGSAVIRYRDWFEWPLGVGAALLALALPPLLTRLRPLG